MKSSRTIRELSGEVWSELILVLSDARKAGDSLYEKIGPRESQIILDVLSGVLARHCGETIVNDEDLPVAPLPVREFPPDRY
jgi:hypothetical protein